MVLSKPQILDTQSENLYNFPKGTAYEKSHLLSSAWIVFNILCTRWNLDKPIDEESEKEHKKRILPAGIEF